MTTPSRSHSHNAIAAQATHKGNTVAQSACSCLAKYKYGERLLKEVMNKPRMPSEACAMLELKRGYNLSKNFKSLQKAEIVSEKAKGLYGLTERGCKIRKELLMNAGMPYTYSEPRLDWKSYVWVMLGSQRMTLLKVLRWQPIFTAGLVRKARGIHKQLSRTDAYKILRNMATRKLTTESRGSKHVLYAITKKGEAIRRQILLLWAAFFLFYIG